MAMRDRLYDLLNQRDGTNRAEFLNSSTAVLTALAASAVVCASIFTLSVAKIAPAVRLATTELPPVEVSLPQAPLGELTVPLASATAPAAEIAAPERVIPAALPPVQPGPAVRVENAPAPGLHQVVFGRPAVDAIPRPTRIEALAAAQIPDVDENTLAALRPAARPLSDAVEAVLAEVVEEDEVVIEGGLLTSLRPAIRPANLDTTSQLAANPAADATITLAALPGPTADTGPSFDRNANACSRRLARAIPRRPGNADGGSQFIATLANASGTSRDAAIAREVMRGNVPAFMRELAPVSFTGVLPNGRSAQITICVTPDYLAVGSDRDFVRVPLGLSAAGQIAEQFNMMLPTTRMVDAIYAQADLRLTPSPMTPGAQMSSTNYFLRHDATVDQQYANSGGRLGMLVSGHKKDLVLTNRLARAPGRVAIYGWHRRGGNPIQPLSTVHGAEYADYSHGIRLVSRTAFVNGQAVDLEDLLMDGTYAGLLNSEGAISRPAIQLASR